MDSYANLITSHPECLVRPAFRNEIPKIVALGLASYAEYRNEVPASVFDAYVDDLGRLEEHWDEAEVLVAEADDRIVGSVVFYASAGTEGLGLPEAWAGFRKLAVHPEARGRSIGRKLVEHCVERARRLRVPAVGIHTASFMKTACSIYERMGFRRCPQHDLSASDMLGVEAGADVLKLIAYRLDLVSP